eukprot:5290383-Amphidinium_carterae.2
MPSAQIEPKHKETLPTFTSSPSLRRGPTAESTFFRHDNLCAKLSQGSPEYSGASQGAPGQELSSQSKNQDHVRKNTRNTAVMNLLYH